MNLLHKGSAWYDFLLCPRVYLTERTVCCCNHQYFNAVLMNYMWITLLNFCSFLSWLPSAVVCFAVFLWIQISENAEELVLLWVHESENLHIKHTLIFQHLGGSFSISNEYFAGLTGRKCQNNHHCRH